MPEFLAEFLAPYLPDIAKGLTSSAWAILAALAAASILATTIVLFKLVQFMVLGVGRRGKAERIILMWLAGNGAGALKLAERRNSVRVRVLYAALSALKAFPNDKDYSRELASQTALLELGAMTRGMRGLDAVVQAAPLLGLLGTVLGMIDAFSKLSETGGADPAVLAGGIWTALLTTAAGLSVALVVYVFSVWFDGRIARERQALEYLISSFLHGRVDPKAGRQKG